MDGWIEPAHGIHAEAASVVRRPAAHRAEHLGSTVALRRRRDAAAESGGEIREVLGEAAWQRLSPAIRRRFSEAALAEGAVHYIGVMANVRCSRLGWLLAQACRLLGTPLAPGNGTDVPVTVSVYRDPRRGGVTWERIYRFPGRRPVKVSSTKCRDAAGRFLEVAAGGIGMWLSVYERAGRLCFRSGDYFVELAGRRITLPQWLGPGETLVVHGDEPAGRFRFTMTIRHWLFGETFFQDGVFQAIEES